MGRLPADHNQPYGIGPADSTQSLHALVKARQLLAILTGAHARPPEDVGDVSGYERFLAIMIDPDEPEHAETRIWCGGHFDPEWFDLALTDKDVRNALKPNVRRRLHQPKPARKSQSS